MGVPWYWVMRDLTLTPNQKLVTLALIEHQRDRGRCWPSQARLALFTGLSPRTVRSTLVQLQAKRIAMVERRTGRTTVYRVDLPNFSMFSVGAVLDRQQMPHTPATGACGNAQPRQTSPTKTPIEPLKKRKEEGGRSERPSPVHRAAPTEAAAKPSPSPFVSQHSVSKKARSYERVSPPLRRRANNHTVLGRFRRHDQPLASDFLADLPGRSFRGVGPGLPHHTSRLPREPFRGGFSRGDEAIEILPAVSRGSVRPSGDRGRPTAEDPRARVT